MSGMKLRLLSAIIGGSAVVGAAALYAGVTSQVSEMDTAKSTVHSTTKPVSTPTVTMAVPGITGPAPLYAGQDPGH
jgi:hypothetical protein